jgi:Leucine-rich repeat (LRR) protein
MAGLEAMPYLVELDLSHNAILDLTTLPPLVHLHKLMLTNNQISDIKGVGRLRSLVHLLLQGNRLRSVDSIALAELSKIESLRTLYLKHIDGSEVCPEQHLALLQVENVTSCGR